MGSSNEPVGTMRGASSRTVPVHTAKATPMSSRVVPMVATSFSACVAPRRSRGRKTTRSRNRPMAGPTTNRASRAEIHSGQCQRLSVCHST